MEFSISEPEMAEYETYNTLFDAVWEMDDDQQVNRIEEMIVSLEKAGPAADGKRRRRRIPCSLVVDYEIDGDAHRGMTRNISEDGMFIKTEKPLAPGQELRLNAGRPGKRLLQFNCTVARTAKDGAGIRFERMNLYSNRIIQSVVKRLLGGSRHGLQPA